VEWSGCGGTDSGIRIDAASGWRLLVVIPAAVVVGGGRDARKEDASGRGIGGGGGGNRLGRGVWGRRGRVEDKTSILCFVSLFIFIIFFFFFLLLVLVVSVFLLVSL